MPAKLKISKDVSLSDGDVVLLGSGDFLQVLELNTHLNGYSSVQHLQKDDPSYLDLFTLNIERNLGQSSETLARYHFARSIHLRLNRMAKI